MNKKLLKILTIGGLFFFVSGLTACGGKGEEPDPEDPVTPSVSKVEISFWQTFGQGIKDYLIPQIETFVKQIKKNEGVDVVVHLVDESDYPTIREDINQGLKVGNIPTIAVCYPDHVADYIYAENGEDGKFVVNLEDFFTNEKYGFGTEKYLGDVEGDSIADFIPGYMASSSNFTRTGSFTLPYMKSTEALIYNLDALTLVLHDYKPELHDSPSEIQKYMEGLDWDEFMELCRQVKTHKDLINPKMEKVAFYDSDANLIISQLYQSSIGYSSLVDNGKGRKVGHIDFADGKNREDAEALVTTLKGYYDEGLFTTRKCYSTYGSNSFKNQEVVFQISSTGGSGYSFSTDFQIGVCRVPPMVKNNPQYVTQGPDLCILRNPKLSDTANANQTLYAWKLLKFLTNSKNNCDICLKGSEGYLPVRSSSYEQDLYLKFLALGEMKADIANLVTGNLQKHFFVSPCFPGSSDLRDNTGGLLTKCLTATGTDDISTYFDEAINNTIPYLK